MYASIDGVMDRLKRKLRKYKERRLDGYHGGKHMAEDFLDALESVDIEDEAMAEISPDPSKEITEVKTEEYVDPEAPVITVIKSFDLTKPISMKEAIFALDYVDHDFFVYRDADSNEVSVVYKRNAGGIGLIQPSQ
eukprot:CAMPEP_0118681468 /NCGR_PEP_ID=MMETSP0800-20121206/4959_1 /TAXON_ID=210618 ORGANISM="Striatella unipunctata, Strain CCMP2910" /NCGR_SAMPLE_ID=MMETSP0800 /ASSEMBLY_ACC=CAM_ASM_000638 /LENGTH=135 /DNA_ID=CAMNT_0006577775 /DNA_START=537 /DNA_END=944 /DNA_ORIENTATION=+